MFKYVKDHCALSEEERFISSREARTIASAIRFLIAGAGVPPAATFFS